MRIALIVLLVLSMGMVACVRGSGNVVTQQREVSGFNRIEIHGRGNLVLTQGDVESVTVEAEDNMITRVNTRVEDGRLLLEMKSALFVRPTRSVTYHVTVCDLTEIGVLGAGAISSTTPIRVPSLKLGAAGACDVNLDLDVDELNFKVAGAGNLTLRGRADAFNAEVVGASDVEALELLIRNATLRTAGATSITMNVSETLSLEVDGACDIRYAGDAEVIKQEISGSSSVSRIR